MPMHPEEKYATLTAVFVLALAAANVIASKVVTIFGFSTPAGMYLGLDHPWGAFYDLNHFGCLIGVCYKLTVRDRYP